MAMTDRKQEARLRKAGRGVLKKALRGLAREKFLSLEVLRDGEPRLVALGDSLEDLQGLLADGASVVSTQQSFDQDPEADPCNHAGETILTQSLVVGDEGEEE